MSHMDCSRRQALAAFASLLSTQILLEGQSAPLASDEPPGRITPMDDIANVFEIERVAERKLNQETFARIAGGDRSALERITFRPRLLIDTSLIDLSLDLVGQSLFSPVLVGPASHQKRFHAQGEIAMAQGAKAANAILIASEHSDDPIEEICSHSASTWYQVYPDTDHGALLERIQHAVKAGCSAVCLTLGTSGQRMELPANGELQQVHAPYNWDKIEQLRDDIGVPLLLKGIMNPSEADTAVERGMAGIVVSNHGSNRSTGTISPVSILPSIQEAVKGRIPILIDGGLRRGSDALKALALGASAVMVCRPALWGLAAYGTLGVQKSIEFIQAELAQDMTMLGTVNLTAINRDHVRVHSR